MSSQTAKKCQGAPHKELFQINNAGFEKENREIGWRITKAINKRKEITTKHWKYVDDLTIGEAIDLKKVLKTDHTLTKPLEYHNRTEHVLNKEDSKVNKQLEDLVTYSRENEMKINKEKTKIMLFNTAKKRDFSPIFDIEGEKIEVVEKYKLLGVQITSDLKWNENTLYVTKRGYTKLWILRRLKSHGANESELRDIYCKHIRSILEYGAAVWHSGLTLENKANIERVQKAALTIILGKRYINYENALATLKLDSLSLRREKLCLKFAKKSFKSKKFATWFQRDENSQNTRRKVNLVKPALARTTRLQKSALPYMTNILIKS